MSAVWEPRGNLQKVIDVINESATALDNNNEAWRWMFNTRCKYIELRIDMRDGAFILKDREGTRISLEELKAQKNRISAGTIKLGE